MKTTDDEIEILLHNIKALRLRSGYSKRKMAQYLGISLYTLNKIEKGECPPRLDIYILFAVYWHFSILPSKLLERKI